MKKNEISVIYIPSTPQNNTVNWITNFCLELGKQNFFSVRILSGYWDFISPLKFWTFSWVVNGWKQRLRKTDLFFEIVPFRRLNFVKELNYLLNFYQLKIRSFLRGKKTTVLILSRIDLHIIKYIKITSPELVIFDACDYLCNKDMLLAHKYSDLVVTNSLPLFNKHRLFGKTELISAGYFSYDQIWKIKKNFIHQDKTVIFIGSIDSRLDFELIEFCMDHLPHIQFNFYYQTLFDRTSKFQSRDFVLKNLLAGKKWKKISLKKNFCGIEITNQEQLSKIPVKGALGIIPYRTQNLFNRYCHPIKFYNYTALGIPIVSVPLMSIQIYQSRTTKFTADSQEFCNAIDLLISVGPDKFRAKSGWRLAINQTFEKKAADLKSILDLITINKVKYSQ